MMNPGFEQGSNSLNLMQQLLQVQASFESQILAKPNVVGVAVGLKESEGKWTNDMALVALVQKKLPMAQLSQSDRIPRSIDNLPTDVYEVGYLRAFDTPPTGRFRPIPAGVSIGHHLITAGTLGVTVKDRLTGETLLLSNNHVLANSNDAQLGDAILQPGPADGGQDPNDIIARLERFIPLRYIEDAQTPLPGNGNGNGGTPIPTNPNLGGCASVLGGASQLLNLVARLSGSGARVVTTASSHALTAQGAPQTTNVQTTTSDNSVDAALARPIDPAMFTGDILGIGQITGTKAPQIGMAVRKAGRTTGYTQSMITLLNATVNVGYSTIRGPRTARFVGQIITQPMSQGGDSGSLIVDGAENRAVGLLFAGSPMATIFTPIDIVLAALNVTF
jgi:hypothetical protein